MISSAPSMAKTALVETSGTGFVPPPPPPQPTTTPPWSPIFHPSIHPLQRGRSNPPAAASRRRRRGCGRSTVCTATGRRPTGRPDGLRREPSEQTESVKKIERRLKARAPWSPAIAPPPPPPPPPPTPALSGRPRSHASSKRATAAAAAAARCWSGRPWNLETLIIRGTLFQEAKCLLTMRRSRAFRARREDGGGRGCSC